MVRDLFALCPELTFLCSTRCWELSAKITDNLWQNTTKKTNIYLPLSFFISRSKQWKDQAKMCVLIALLWLKNVVGIDGLLDGAERPSSISRGSAIGKVTTISPAQGRNLEHLSQPWNANYSSSRNTHMIQYGKGHGKYLPSDAKKKDVFFLLWCCMLSNFLSVRMPC